MKKKQILRGILVCLLVLLWSMGLIPVTATAAVNSSAEPIQIFSNPFPIVPSPMVNDYFGEEVAIDGDRVLISAPLANKKAETGLLAWGAVYLFQASTGKLLQTFPGSGGFFGDSIAIDGDNVLIGAYQKDPGVTNAGEAYLFKASTGELLHTFSNPSPAVDDNFGYKLDIDGDNVVIGAYRKDAGAKNSGEAYLFKVSTGELVHTFSDPFPAVDNNFASKIAIDGDRVAIGAIGKNAGAKSSGEAYLFKISTGELLSTFSNPSPAVDDYFGFKITIDGDNVVIGSYFKDTEAEDSGEAYLFQASTGELLHTFSNPEFSQEDYFGKSVAMDGDKVVIGAYRKDAGAEDSGEAYLFQVSTGELLHTFSNPSPEVDDYFGYRAAMDGNIVLISAPGDYPTYSGEVYLYDLQNILNIDTQKNDKKNY